MRTEVIKADTIEAAVQGILNELGASSNKENFIYFDGWDGLGASAVLQAVAKRFEVAHEPLTRFSGLEFDEIIHIDCSKWESIRAMQREIAEQLKLPTQVIEMFDKQDEEDDFNGLDQGSRGEIEQITRKIYLAVQNQRFLIILQNGSNEEIDILNFGLSLYGYTNNKMLWTFQGRFRLHTKMIDNLKKSTTTHVLLSASRDKREPQELWSYLVRHEGAQVSCNKHGHEIIDPDIAAECVLYMLKQCCIGSHIVDYDWAIHTNNFWVCDGIIALTDIDKAWQVGDVLQHEVRLFGINNQVSNDKSTIMLSPHLARSTERMPYWNSTATCGFVLSPSGLIPDNIFQHSDRLGVLKLSWCSFSFSSPPFLCCQSLRFLWLDHCKDLLTRSTPDHHHTGGYKEEFVNNSTRSWACFQSLWVLDLRYTECHRILSATVMDLMTELRELNVMGAENWDMSHLSGRLRNIRKLRITKSSCFFNNNVLSDMESLELLDFSRNSIKQGMASLSGAASRSSLKTIVIDGCDGLQNISLRGCKELKNLLLKGSLGNLEELDLSGTRVKTINLKEVEASSLPNQIILLGCDMLRAILWPRKLELRECPNLLIDTTSTSASAEGGKAAHTLPHGNSYLKQLKEEKFKYGWKIFLADSRLLRSLAPISSYLHGSSLHIDICTTTTVGHSNAQGERRSYKLVQVQPHTSTMVDSKYRDVLKDCPLAQIMSLDGPNINPKQAGIKVIIHVQGNKLLDAPSNSTNSLLLPDFICYNTTSLHMYDNPSITSTPEPPHGWRSDWRCLRWCRVERCPKLHTVFTNPHGGVDPNGGVADRFQLLDTFWASHLLTARYIWDRTITATYKTLSWLKHLHLDYCPRLVHVLSLSLYMHPLCYLETLEIAWCGELKEVFPLGPDLEDQGTYVTIPYLRCIYLHELPMLQNIFGRRACVPSLETIKIRGCWSLRCLPVIGRNTKPPKVDCEKEWWDNLEWDGLDKYHHPYLYEPSHSLYYKKARVPRGTLLR